MLRSLLPKRIAGFIILPITHTIRVYLVDCLMDKEEVPAAGDIAGTPADILRDQLEQLPDGAERLILVQLLRTSELREVLDGLITDVIAACQAESLPAVAEAVNGWVATAEETVASRRKLRHIIAARERMRKQTEDAA